MPLIMLNPPFSCRGGARINVRFARTAMECSRALAFVLHALRFMSSEGEIIAILPAGCLRTLKDQKALMVLQHFYHLDVIQTNGHRTFDGCVPHTAIIRIAKRSPREAAKKPTWVPRPKVSANVEVTLFRGNVPMHTVTTRKKKDELPLVHSTSLRGSKVNLAEFNTGSSGRKLKGPAILLPRVGMPCKSKMVLYKGQRTFVLSECVLALKCSRSGLARVYDCLCANWPALADLYRGTGAKYVCVSEVATVLRAHGFRVIAPIGANWSRQLVRAIEHCGAKKPTPFELAEFESELSQKYVNSNQSCKNAPQRHRSSEFPQRPFRRFGRRPMYCDR